jgi:hypothetical protein
MRTLLHYAFGDRNKTLRNYVWEGLPSLSYHSGLISSISLHHKDVCEMGKTSALWTLPETLDHALNEIRTL